MPDESFVWERDIRRVAKANKKIYLARHARARAKERYGVEMTPRDYRQLCRRIRNGHRAKCVWRDARKGIEVWEIEGSDRWPTVFAMWYPSIQRIVTFLKPGWAKTGWAKGVSIDVEPEDSRYKVTRLGE
jgi:hypothetical protein